MKEKPQRVRGRIRSQSGKLAFRTVEPREKLLGLRLRNA